jgi:hypothetical protein
LTISLPDSPWIVCASNSCSNSWHHFHHALGTGPAEHCLHANFRVSTIAFSCACCGFGCDFDSLPFSMAKTKDSGKASAGLTRRRNQCY